MISLKLNSDLNYCKRICQRWSEITEVNTISDIVNLALEMMVEELGYEYAVVFVHEEESSLYKARHHRGYSDFIDLQMLQNFQVHLSDGVVVKIRNACDPIIHTSNNPVLEVQSLLHKLHMRVAVLSAFGSKEAAPFGFVVVGNSDAEATRQFIDDERAIGALNNLFIHLSHTVNGMLFFKALTQERKCQDINVELRTNKILEQKKQFQAIFDDSIDGIAILDLQTRVFDMVNPAFVFLTGYSREVLLNSSCKALIASDSLSAIDQAFENVLQYGYASDFLTYCVDANDKRISVNMSMVLMHDKKHILLSAKDMTQRYNLERELLEAKDKAEVAQAALVEKNKVLEELTETLENKVVKRTFELEQALADARDAANAKSQFLATMSHEIRTPMNGVLGMTELLANSPLSDEQRQLLRVLQSSGRTLLTLIDDILDFSKIEAGKLELENIPIDIPSFLTDLRDTFTIQAQARGFELMFATTQDLPKVIRGDPTRLRQVFSNLIVNAIKFTHEGHVTVSVVKTVRAEEYEVSIQDTGIGIGEEIKNRLFTAFTQANSSVTRQYGGTGLGLVICAMLVKLMGGRIWLESEQGKGSTFRFTFKAQRVDESWIPSIPPVEPAKDLGHLKVLLVEDHQINRLLVSKILNQVNIYPDLACDGLEAIACLQEKEYDVILMDIQMPNMDGLTATKKIRADVSINQPYIIALTANAFSEDKASCFSAGMDGFISKPVSADELVRSLKKIKYKGII